MFIFLITVHIITCLLLILIVLMQAGRGGGLAESFSSAESIFGTKTSTLLTRTTTVLAIIFFITCLGLAYISKQKSKSLLEQIPVNKVGVTEEEDTTEKKLQLPEQGEGEDKDNNQSKEE